MYRKIREIRILYPFTDGAYAEDANSTNSTKALDHTTLIDPMHSEIILAARFAVISLIS